MSAPEITNEARVVVNNKIIIRTNKTKNDRMVIFYDVNCKRDDRSKHPIIE